jgi:meiosis arrest female protein 1
MTPYVIIATFTTKCELSQIQELSEGERTVSLTLNQSFKVLGSQVVTLVRNSPTSSLPLDELPRIYLKECGYPLKPHVYECETFLELIEKICDYIQVFGKNIGPSNKYIFRVGVGDILILLTV